MIVGRSGASGEQNGLGALAAGDAVLSLGTDDQIAARHELVGLAADGERRLAGDQHRVLGRRVPVRRKHVARRKLRVGDRGPVFGSAGAASSRNCNDPSRLTRRRHSLMVSAQGTAAWAPPVRIAGDPQHRRQMRSGNTGRQMIALDSLECLHATGLPQR